MLYLIGGPPRCGKTTLSRALAMALEIPYFSIDHVASVITPYLSAEGRTDGLALRSLYQQVAGDNDELFERFSPQEIVSAYRKQAETCWPGIQNFIQYAIDDEHSLILEGWQLLPDLVNEVPSARVADTVQVKFLYKTEVTDICSGLKANREKNDWVLKNTKRATSFPRIAEMISTFGSHIRESAATAGFETLNMDADFERKIAAATAAWTGGNVQKNESARPGSLPTDHNGVSQDRSSEGDGERSNRSRERFPDSGKSRA